MFLLTRVYRTSPHSHDVDLSEQADLALSRAEEDKDKEIERLNRQVRDLQEASKRFYDQIQVIGDTMSRDCSIEDDVFTSSLRNYSINSASVELGIEFNKFDGGAVIIQPYNGILGTSPFDRISLLSELGEQDTGIYTENEIQSHTANSNR